MDELRSILAAWEERGRDLAGSVLATVVHVKGSAYRRPGARMLILPNGTRIGTISGGCLEGDVARKASWWTAEEGVALRTFDTSSEEAAWDFGLGCNGIITVLLERAHAAPVRRMLECIETWTRQQEEGLVATVIRASGRAGWRAGDRLCWQPGQPAEGSSTHPETAADLERALADRATCLVHLPEADVLVERIRPPQHLVIFGAGHDVIPVVALGRLLGWQITVVDSRPAYAQPGRFPGAEQVLVLPASADITAVPIRPDSAVVMMTHNYPQDQVLLPQILARKPRYLGMLGPRRRTERLFDETGENLAAHDVHAPVGLDLGGDHPEGIALSIVSEIQATLAERAGGHLRERSGPIHGPVRECGLLPRPEWSDPAEHTALTACEVSGAAGRG